jgi:hypothetical protein
LLSAVAGSLGVGLAIVFTSALRTFAGFSPAFGPLGNFLVTSGVVAQGLILSALVGIFAGFSPAYGAVRRTVVEVLHEVF